MATYVDGVMVEWGDRLFRIKTKSRPAAKTVCGYKRKAPAAPKQPSRLVRAVLERTAKKAPEVMVKITSGRKDPATGKRNTPCSDMRGIKAHMDYISRNGDVALEDENGNQILGKDAVRELRDDWKTTSGEPIPYENGYRREAYNVVLSMPPGTDPEAVKAAAREFAKETFAGREYVFAAHDDEAHPHVHLCVKAKSRDLVRLNPRKADLQQWRETFAAKLQEQGIEANATPRRARGQSHVAERQEIRHIVKDGRTSTARAGRAKAVDDEVKTGKKQEHPAEEKLRQGRADVVQAYGKIAKALAASDAAEDRKLAVELVGLVKTMPPPTSTHREAVAELQQQPGGEGRGKVAPDRSTGPQRG